MGVNITEWAAAGLAAIHVSKRGSGGYLAGFGGLTVANTDTASGMRRLRGAQVAPFAIPEPDKIPIDGDNSRITTFQFGSNADNAFVIEMGITDTTFEAAAQGSTVYTLGDWDMSARGPSNPNPVDMIFLLTRNAESQEVASQGDAGWENLLLPSTNVMPLGDDRFASREEGGSRYSVIADPALVTPWGATMLATFGLSDGISATWFSENPCVMHCWVSDGTEDDFEVDYTPVSVAKTKVFDYTASAALTVSGINAGTKNVALSAPPATGHVCVCIYECTGF